MEIMVYRFNCVKFFLFVPSQTPALVCQLLVNGCWLLVAGRSYDPIKEAKTSGISPLTREK